MRNRPFIVIAAVLAGMLAGVGGSLRVRPLGPRHDRQGRARRRRRLGGLDAAKARAKLERAVPGSPARADRRLPRQAHLLAARRAQAGSAADLDGMVDAGDRAGPRGQPVRPHAGGASRGGRLDAATCPRDVTYSRPAVSQLITRIREVVDRPPARRQDRSSRPTSSRAVPSQDGLDRPRRRAAPPDPPRDRRSRRRAQAGRPRPATSSRRSPRPARQGVRHAADRRPRRLPAALLQEAQARETYSVARRQVGLETPAGLYHIQNKAVNPAWTCRTRRGSEGRARQGHPRRHAENPLKARWLGIYDGAGIHGIDPSQYGTIGHAASHGCVRMRIPDVEALYDKVPVGAPIYIA